LLGEVGNVFIEPGAMVLELPIQAVTLLYVGLNRGIPLTRFFHNTGGKGGGSLFVFSIPFRGPGGE